MKKHLLWASAMLCLFGCGGSDFYNMNRETRYFAYIGEPVAVLYENFGTPYKGIKYSDTERALIFHTQDYEREWSYIDYRYCDITFFLRNDVVASWKMEGNQCAINEADNSKTFFESALSDLIVTMPNGSLGSIAGDAFGGEVQYFDGGTDDGFLMMPDDGGRRPSAMPSGVPSGHVIADDAF